VRGLGARPLGAPPVLSMSASAVRRELAAAVGAAAGAAARASPTKAEKPVRALEASLVSRLVATVRR